MIIGLDNATHLDLQSKLDYVMGKALRKNVFTGCSLGFFKTDNTIVKTKIWNYGRTGLCNETKKISDSTIFDLASLTKPLVTSLIFLILLDKGIVKFEDNLLIYFKNLTTDKSGINLRHLLTHTSGLPAHRHFFKLLIKIPLKERMTFLINNILTEKLSFKPGKSCLYSDLGFILLGYLIELTTGEKLDIFWEKNVFNPLKIDKKLFFINNIDENQNDFAETGVCSWSKRKLIGLVNDENCRALGGVSGHAGLFGSMSGLLKYLEIITTELSGITNILNFNKKTIDTFFIGKKESTWINGFDTPAEVSSSSGKYFSDDSFGHLGFTGTSFWIDIKLGCGVVFLTNRVLCGDDLNAIKKLRPLVYNIIMESIISKKL